MRSPFARLLVGPLLVLLVAALCGAVAQAISQSDTAYYDGFQDLSGLDAARSSDVVLDALGGVRLRTKGAATPSTWTSQTHFTTTTPPGELLGLSTLDASATPGSLKLLSSPLAFRRVQTDPVLEPAPPLSVDGFGVGGMCVQRVGTTYYMWYTGVPENEFAQSIYLATSADGLNWTKEATPVLQRGAPGSFDSRQLGKPSVVYDPTNIAAPFRMWYAGEGDLGGSIGYATSLDGRLWTKYMPEGATEPQPVYAPGKIGMADSYRVTHPCVLIANGVYFMWYTADDSNNKRVAYATSVDGVTWDRGGVVFDVGTGNEGLAVFAPAVVRTGLETPDPNDDAFHMVFTANKSVAGDDIQSKLINGDSTDGITWSSSNIAFSSAGGDTSFDGWNVSQPAILHDPLDVAHPYKMWYVGNNPDENGNYHDRIGLAYQKQPSSVSQWEKVPGTTLGAPYFESWVTLGEQGTAFDSMKVADLRAVAKPAAAGEGVYGFYTGTNAADFTQRIGVMQSADGGVTWTEANAHATLIGAGPAGAFDEGGVACPAPVTNAAGGWWLLHTSFDAAGTPSIGLHAVAEDLASATRTAAAPVLAASGTAYDAAGQADPWAYVDGGQLGVFYAGKDAAGVWSLGLAASMTGDPASLSGAHQILAPTPSTYDAGGLRKPVAHKMVDGSWRLFYAAIGEDGVSRIAYATSANGSTWTKQGLVMTESTAAYDFAEGGVEPCTAGPAGRAKISSSPASTASAGPASARRPRRAPGYLDGGRAEYLLDNTEPRDWRRILWSPATQPAGGDAQVWVSYYPTYSGDWSNAFPITNDTDLPFLLTVEDMRWEVRMTSTDTSVTPQLDDLTVNHAPIQFPASGKAVTLPIGPPDGLYLLTWGDLTIDADIPGGSGMSVTVEDDAGARIVASQPVTAGGTTIPLAGVAPLGAKLVAVVEFTSDGGVTPKLKSIGATYTSTTTPAQMTLTAAKTVLTYGSSTTLSGKLFSDPTPLVPDDADSTPLAGQTVTIKAHAADATGYATVGTADDGRRRHVHDERQAGGGDELPGRVGRRDDRHGRLPAGLRRRPRRRQEQGRGGREQVQQAHGQVLPLQARPHRLRQGLGHAQPLQAGRWRDTRQGDRDRLQVQVDRLGQGEELHPLPDLDQQVHVVVEAVGARQVPRRDDLQGRSNAPGEHEHLQVREGVLRRGGGRTSAASWQPLRGRAVQEAARPLDPSGGLSDNGESVAEPVERPRRRLSRVRPARRDGGRAVRIAFLGDSLTEGFPGASYFRLLRHLMPEHELLNHGRAGDSVADLYARLLATGFEASDLTVIWIGTNDAAMGPWTSWGFETLEPLTWEATLAQLDAVYRRVLAFALERARVRSASRPSSRTSSTEAWARRVADVGEVVAAAAAAEPRAGLLDLAPAFDAARAAAPAPVGFTIDGVHLSEAGAEVVAEALRQAVGGLFEA